MIACLSYAPPPRYPKERYSSFFVLKIPTLRPLVLLTRAARRRSTERWCKVTDRGIGKCWEKKPVPLPLCPPQTPHGLDWDRTPASVE